MNYKDINNLMFSTDVINAFCRLDSIFFLLVERFNYI